MKCCWSQYIDYLWQLVETGHQISHECCDRYYRPSFWTSHRHRMSRQCCTLSFLSLLLYKTRFILRLKSLEANSVGAQFEFFVKWGCHFRLLWDVEGFVFPAHVASCVPIGHWRYIRMTYLQQQNVLVKYSTIFSKQFKYIKRNLI